MKTGFDDRMTGEVKRANYPIGLGDFDSRSIYIYIINKTLS